MLKFVWRTQNHKQTYQNNSRSGTHTNLPKYVPKYSRHASSAMFPGRLKLAIMVQYGANFISRRIKPSILGNVLAPVLFAVDSFDWLSVARAVGPARCLAARCTADVGRVFVPGPRFSWVLRYHLPLAECAHLIVCPNWEGRFDVPDATHYDRLYLPSLPSSSHRVMGCIRV